MQLSEKTKNKLKGVMPVTKEEREDALASACMQVKRVLPEFTTKFQNAYSENGFYRPIDNVEWTTGFWTGEIWLAYEYGGEDVLLKAAEIQMQDFLHRIEQKICVDHHDMGFLYTPSCVAGYKLTGSGTGKRAALLAADQLKSRFQEKGEFIQAWGTMGEPENYGPLCHNCPSVYKVMKKGRNILREAQSYEIRERGQCSLFDYDKAEA